MFQSHRRFSTLDAIHPGTRKSPIPILLGSLIAAACTSMAQAQSQQDVQEIVVSADFRNSRLNDISSSISVIDSSLIDHQNARHLEEMLLNTPNVNLSSGASRSRFFQIRGIGERSQFIAPMNPSVGLLLDGVDFSGAGTMTTLYDVEQVEVLMGPQGTRYGSNALAGLINMQSKAPTETFRAGAQADRGNYDTLALGGYVSGPVNESLRYRLSAHQLKSDGFSTNRFLNRPTNQRDETTVRGRLRWDVSEETQVDFSAMFIDIDNGFDAFSLDNVRDTLADEPGVDQQRTRAFSVTVNSSALTLADVQALFSYADSDSVYGFDEDWVYAGFHPAGYNSSDYYFRDRRNQTAEVRFLSNDSSRLFGGRTDWVVGVFSLQQDEDLRREYTYLNNDFYSRFSIDRLALYGETNTRLNDRFSLDVGLRIEHFESRYQDNNLLAFNPSNDLYGGKIALNYHSSDDSLIYLSASRGYKTGGFNTDGSVSPELRQYDQEYLWNYELGYKASYLENRLTTQLALFYMDRNDVQINSSQEQERSDGSREFIIYIGNAAGGKNYGLEWNTQWRVTEAFQLYGSLGLLESAYRNFINSAGDNLHGRQQAHAPRYQFNLGSDLWFTERLHLNVNAQGRDDFFFSDSHDERSISYVLYHASLNYHLDNWRFSLWGRNLGNKDYFVRGFFFGNDPRDGYTSRGFTQLGEPRQFGLKVNYDF